VFDHPESYALGFRCWYRWLFRRLARHAERALTVSAFSQQRLAAALGVPPQRLQVVPGGADHLEKVDADVQALARHGLVGTRYLLTVGSANPSKNFDRLVRAYARLPQASSTRLVIVGGKAPRVFANAAMATDPPGVQRLGPVDDATLKALYGQATALVFPSLYEGFGLPPLEAMACGCPVAAARVAAMPEVLGDAALWFDPHDEASITAAMARMLADGELRARLCTAGREQADRWTWDLAAGRLLAALHPLA
jgi:glycosyltransferase involved in cell wall biosynthesis